MSCLYGIQDTSELLNNGLRVPGNKAMSSQRQGTLMSDLEAEGGCCAAAGGLLGNPWYQHEAS